MVAIRSVAAFAAILAASTVCASALSSGNLNYLTPIRQLPHLAAGEPEIVVEAVHFRKLLQGTDGSESIWTPRQGDASKTADVFGQGVASGDPFAESVILWTRINPVAGQDTRPAVVDWAVSETKDFAKPVSRGTTVTTKDVDYTVKVEADKLKPATKYFYQFRYRSGKTVVYSVVGRTQTIPTPDADNSRVRISFFSCSNLPTAYFTAYGQVAQAAERGEVDFHMHVGDYIYEGKNDGNANFKTPEERAARTHQPEKEILSLEDYSEYKTDGNANFKTPEERAARTHQPEKEILTLEDYRTRHTQYNNDFDTQWMRRSAPLIPVWDDHEYANNAWRHGAQNHQPATEGDWEARRLRALQVYYEMMPIRQVDADDKQRIYRDFKIGKLVRLIMLDTRIIGRDEQNGTARDDPTRTILGAPQKQYLKDTLSDASSSQTWKVIGQQVLFTHRCDRQSSDQWDGYRQDQNDVLDHLADNKINNTIVLSGDIHTHWANDLPKYPCPNEANYNYDNTTGAGSLAVEFVSSSITSGWNPSDANRASKEAAEVSIKANNPQVRYQESFYKGFAVVDLTKDAATSTWYYPTDLYTKGAYDKMIKGESWKAVVNTNHLVKAD